MDASKIGARYALPHQNDCPIREQNSMSEKILFVDDDANLLAACRRNLGRQFAIDTAEGGEAALAKLAKDGPYAVVVADRQMPGMDGIELLSKVWQQAPDTVRIMLTGNANLEAAIQVVNEGNIFRFLNKPCPAELLTKALHDGLTQHRLVTAEKELLNKTLGGSIKLLTDILSMVEPQSFGRAQTLRDTIATVTNKLNIPNAWEIHLAIMLGSIGYVTIPPATVVKARAGHPLSEAEEQMMLRVPETGARLLANIPRLEGVSRIVLYQNKCFDGSGFPQDSCSGDAIPLGSRLLKILLDLMQIQAEGKSQAKALGEMQDRGGRYDPALFSAVQVCLTGGGGGIKAPRLSLAVSLSGLVTGMVLRSNLETTDGTLLLSTGHEINQMTLEKIQNFARVFGIKEPIQVESPMMEM